MVTSAGRLKSLFLHANIHKYTSFEVNIPNKIKNVFFSNRQSGVKVLHILNSLDCFTLICNVKLVLAEMAIFAIIKHEDFCKCKLINVRFIVFERKDATVFIFKSQLRTKLSIWMFNDIFIEMSKEIVL